MSITKWQDVPGRRGIDAIGYVYSQIIPAYADTNEIKSVVTDKVEPIESQFNLSYSSILNLYEKYGDDIYDVYTMSLSNHQNRVRLATLNEQIKDKIETLQTLPKPECIHDSIDGSEQIQKHHRHKRNREKRASTLTYREKPNFIRNARQETKKGTFKKD